MIKKCGNCLNQHTWDCPRVETYCDDENVCNMYFKVDNCYVDENGHIRSEVPKKPIVREHDELRGEILFHCPTCDDDFNCNEYKDSYCPECGQAIDWSEKIEDEE